MLDDRIQNRSTIATIQLPVDCWHQLMANPLIADATLDQLVQLAYRIESRCESMRSDSQNPSKRCQETATEHAHSNPNQIKKRSKVNAAR
ncbi:MAG: hypothetical protein F4058_01140 [Rhodothermaceae bacterium]|nr:hypothetical protein [Rhodothermaceae bacterium]MYF63090.1 hypothetical protein [Rhodothermaceae bacterium]MYI83916.1 hypothetical protein [Rhodothermaceae bacterium]